MRGVATRTVSAFCHDDRRFAKLHGRGILWTIDHLEHCVLLLNSILVDALDHDGRPSACGGDFESKVCVALVRCLQSDYVPTYHWLSSPYQRMEAISPWGLRELFYSIRVRRRHHHHTEGILMLENFNKPSHQHLISKAPCQEALSVHPHQINSYTHCSPWLHC
jgi:hypothetical protein